MSRTWTLSLSLSLSRRCQQRWMRKWKSLPSPRSATPYSYQTIPLKRMRRVWLVCLVCVYIYIYIYIFIYIYKYIDRYMYINIHIYIYIFIHISIYLHMCVCILPRSAGPFSCQMNPLKKCAECDWYVVCVYIYIYTYIHVYIHIYMCIFTYVCGLMLRSATPYSYQMIHPYKKNT